MEFPPALMDVLNIARVPLELMMFIILAKIFYRQARIEERVGRIAGRLGLVEEKNGIHYPPELKE